jgi:hypothetical protein
MSEACHHRGTPVPTIRRFAGSFQDFSVPADTPGPNWHIGLESKRHFWAVRQENPGNFMNAKEMIMKPSTIAKTLTIAAVTALVLGRVNTIAEPRR